MGFLRRILGGGDTSRDSSGEGRDGRRGEPGDAADPPIRPVDAATVDAEERARELELARFDQDRVDDLVRRQQRYADRSWTPPPQGGEKRADDVA